MSWLDDEPFDPDDDASRELMMLALQEPTPFDPLDDGNGTGTMGVTSTSNSSTRVLMPHGHSLHNGPPYLRCSVPWGLMLLREANPSHSALRKFEAPLKLLAEQCKLTVSVDWCGLTCSTACRLSVRRAGRELVAVDGRCPDELSLSFSVADAAPGQVHVAMLSWGDAACSDGEAGSRHLHMLAPLHSPLPLSRLIVAPSGVALEGTNAPPPDPMLFLGDGGGGPALRTIDRGLGIELEVITLAPDPERSGCFTKGEEMAALIATIRRAATAATMAAEDSDQLSRVLRRCEAWTHEVDDHVMPSAARIAARTAAEARGGELRGAGDEDDEDSDGGEGAPDMWSVERRLCGGGPGTMKSEFKSPPPRDGALNFARDGALEIRCFMRLLRCLGAGAPAVSSSGNSCTSVHVHVNVRDHGAGGDRLSCREILHVFLCWVRYDLVTAKFARPWMWREPSMAPLYATGSEFSWREAAWEQGSAASADPHPYDVPLFLRAVRGVLHAPGFDSLSDDAQVEALFGRGRESPATRIGRYTALNLRRLTTYGTLEVRRFHACLDEEVVTRWAHFCVGFVERFRSDVDGFAAALLSPDMSERDALEALREAQEVATAEELVRQMSESDGSVRHLFSAESAEVFMRDSGAHA